MIHTVGIIGCGPMAQTLVLQLKKIGVTPHIYNRTSSTVDYFVQKYNLPPNLSCSTYQELIERLPKPRMIFLSLREGVHMDYILKELLTYLHPGDTIIDTGNSKLSSTQQRSRLLAHHQCRFLAVTICNGAELLNGRYSFLVSGDRQSYQAIKPLLTTLSNPQKEVPLLYDENLLFAPQYKQLHNLIEYGWMQLIMEIQHLASNTKELFDQWLQWEPFSLLKIASTVHSSPTILNKIEDVVYEKGTSKALVQQFIQQEYMLPLSYASIMYRYMSQAKKVRLTLSHYAQNKKKIPLSNSTLIQAAHLCMHRLIWEYKTLMASEKIQSLCLLWESDCLISCPFWKQWAHSLHQPHFSSFYEANQGNLKQAIHTLKQVNIAAITAHQSMPLLTSTYQHVI